MCYSLRSPTKIFWKYRKSQGNMGKVCKVFGRGNSCKTLEMSSGPYAGRVVCPNFGRPALTSSYKVYVLCRCCTVWCNKMGTVFRGMSSWTPLTWHIGMKNKSMESKSSGVFITKIIDFKTDWRKCVFKEIQHKTARNS